MSRHTIGGVLDMKALATLHQPPHERSLADARHALRQAAAALKATDHPNPATMQELGRVHALVADALVGIETLGRSL